MPLQKILFKPGVNKENTRYTNEGGWYDCDKIRFRQGTPEKIGGWQLISNNTYEGTCRSLWTWSTLSGSQLTGVGTNKKFYIEQGGAYNDITPIRSFVTLSGPFAATNGSTTVTVTSASHGCVTGDYVNFLGAASLSRQTFTRSTATNFVLATTAFATNTPVTLTVSSGGSLPSGLSEGLNYYITVVSGTTVNLSYAPGGSAISTTTAGSGTFYIAATTGITATILNTSFEVTVLTGNTFTITTSVAATAYDVGNGGTTVNANYEIPAGNDASQNQYGWGTGTWSSGQWGQGQSGTVPFRIWYQNNFGQDLIYGYRGGPLYYWNAAQGVTPTSTTITINSQTVTGVTTGGGAGSVLTFATAIANGTPVKLTSTGTVPPPLVSGTVYYVVDASGATCRVAATYGGTFITLTGAGTGTISIFTPTTFSYTSTITDGAAIQLTTTGTLPSGLTIGTVYYVQGYTGTTFNLGTTATSDSIVLTAAGTGTAYVYSHGIPVTSLAYASDVPTMVNNMMVSDSSRFTLAFGCTPLGDTVLDPMLIRWSDQESVVNWTPAGTNQAGGIRLSHGSEIRSAVQTRQEIVVFTDSTVYSLQYLGPPYVWGVQLLGDGISIAGYNTSVVASGVVYWMGVDKIYKYDGRVNTLRCDLRQYIYGDINLDQQNQFFASTNEGFNEVWWFYCSADSTTIDRYVVYNYLEDVWYYGTMARTAWLDSGLNLYPIAATYSHNIVNHELGVNDNTTGTPAAIEASITSSQFDIGDGHNFGFVWRIVPDLTFRGSSELSTDPTPQVTMYVLPLKNSGSGYNDPVESGNQSVGGTSYANVTRVGTYTVDQFTGQVYTRARGRQMALKITSDRIGTAWQLGAPRLDIRPDGRR